MMKTFTNLYPQVYSFGNLYHAFRQARLGKRDRVAVADFEFDLEINLALLSRQLREQTYTPGPYTNFYIREPKRRLISAAPFCDRVVHHALCQVIEPIWEARFIHHSYACRIGKGTHKALDQAQHWVQQYRYALHGDIVKYFPAIDHAILRTLLARRLADPGAMWLIDQILAGSVGVTAAESPQAYFPGDDLFAITRPRGLPIGNLTSQFWANVYLHELDSFVKHTLRCGPYLRYMDDFVLFSNDKKELRRFQTAIQHFLAGQLRLILHPVKTRLFPTHTGLDFCGFSLFPTHRRLRRSSVRRFIHRFRRQRIAYTNGLLSLEDIHLSVRSWIAHAAHGDTWRLRDRLFSDYPLPRPPHESTPASIPSLYQDL